MSSKTKTLFLYLKAEINKEGKLPNIIDDGALMNKLLVDGFKQIDISNRPVYL